MNLMDMLSSDGPEAMYQQDDSINTLIDHRESIDTAYSQPKSIEQPPNAVYHFPTVLTNIQKDMVEFCLKLFGPEMVSEIYLKLQKTKIHSLLDAEDEIETPAAGLGFNEKLDFVFDQLQTTTKHPSLLVDHFLPKKLLLLEINDRFVNMSGSYLLFNKLVDAILDTFFHSVNLPEPAVYHILVVAESVKELEMIESLIIGKRLYYNNVSTMKLYDDNHGYPPHFNREEKPESENVYKSRRVRKSTQAKSKPQLCLHLITTLQLYNNCTSVLDPEIQFKLIFSFDCFIDSTCPSIEMIRNQEQNVYEQNPMQIPILIPIPIYSIYHIEKLIPKPSNSAFNSSYMNQWKRKVMDTLMYNRSNIFEQDETDFFAENYGSNMSRIVRWFLDWELQPFPAPNELLLSEYSDKITLLIHEEKLTKIIDHTYLLPFHKTELQKDFKLDAFDYMTYQTKFTELLSSRLQQIDRAIINLQKDLPEKRQNETKRQLLYDQDEEKIAENYRKLCRLNEDATFVEKRHLKVDGDLRKFTTEKSEYQRKLDVLHELSGTKDEDVDSKLAEQAEILEKLSQEQSKLSEEYTKLNSENDTIRVQYQETSNEALQLSVQIQKIKEKNTKIETKANGPGIKILPSLIKKDDLINHEQTLKKLHSENEFLRHLFQDKLDKLVNERKTLMEQSTSTSRANNRVSRASTPY